MPPTRDLTHDQALLVVLHPADAREPHHHPGTVAAADALKAQGFQVHVHPLATGRPGLAADLEQAVRDWEPAPVPDLRWRLSLARLDADRIPDLPRAPEGTRVFATEGPERALSTFWLRRMLDRVLGVTIQLTVQVHPEADGDRPPRVDVTFNPRERSILSPQIGAGEFGIVGGLNTGVLRIRDPFSGLHLGDVARIGPQGAPSLGYPADTELWRWQPGVPAFPDHFALELPGAHLDEPFDPAAWSTAPLAAFPDTAAGDASAPGPGRWFRVHGATQEHGVVEVGFLFVGDEAGGGRSLVWLGDPGGDWFTTSPRPWLPHLEVYADHVTFERIPGPPPAGSYRRIDQGVTT